MKTVIQFNFKTLELRQLETLTLPVKGTSIKIGVLILDDRSYLIQVLHTNLNTLLNFSKSKDYQLIYLDAHKNFLGASYVLNNLHGDFFI
jgi:hypothetical protein